MFRNHNRRQISVSEPITSVSNQRCSCDPFANSMQFSSGGGGFFSSSWGTGQRQLLRLSLVVFRKLPQKYSSEIHLT